LIAKGVTWNRYSSGWDAVEAGTPGKIFHTTSGVVEPGR
jgi:hypothetical protein